MAEDTVDVGNRALENVEESAGVEVRLLEVEVELGTEGLRLGVKSVTASAFNPLAILLSSSTFVWRMFAVVHIWVRDKPARW